MNKKIVISALSVAMVATVDVAYADEPAAAAGYISPQEYRPVVVVPNEHNRFHLGFGMDVGAPSGGTVGLVMNPWTDWARLQLSLTDNGLSLGGRASLQLDPLALALHCPIGLFADVQAGFEPEGHVPGHSTDWPSVGYDYVNTYVGLRLGNPNGFHWNLEGGPSYMHVFTGNFQSLVSKTGSSNLVIGNPTVNGWLIPTVETGFTVVW